METLTLMESDILRSIIQMENRLTRYKDERNDFIASIDNTSQPVSTSFYKDIIQPFIENSLIMDNIAKSEGVCWETKEDITQKVNPNGCSKLRIRVFYHKDISGVNKIKKCSSKGVAHISCMENCCNCVNNTTLSLSDMGINEDEWTEIVAHYNGVMVDKSPKNLCIHQLPYFKQSNNKDLKFYKNIEYTLNDIEIAIPGSLGTHAIYSVLENHIRNTAKHADRTLLNAAQHLDIIIKISKKLNGNVEDLDYYNFELTSNIPTIKCGDQPIVLDKIKKFLYEPIDNNTKGLGYADMRINAVLLAFDEIKQENLDKSISVDTYPRQYRGSCDSDFSYSLTYKMKLTKACKILFVGDVYEELTKNANDRMKLDENGCRQYNSVADCILALGDKTRSFQFAVINSNIFNSLTLSYKESSKKHVDVFLKCLPWRVLVTSFNNESSDVLKNLIDSRRVTIVEDLEFKIDEINSWLQNCWDKWLNNRWDGIYKLNLFFQENCNEGVTKRYIDGTQNIRDEIKPVILCNDDKIINPYDQNTFYVFYDRHGTHCLDSVLLNNKDKAFEDILQNKRYNFNWVCIDKNNPDFDRINNDKLDNPEISVFKLIESGLNKILVIDERTPEVSLIKAKHSTHAGNKFEDMKYICEALSGRVYLADSFLIDGVEVLSQKKDVEHKNHFLQVSYLNNELKFNGKLEKFTHWNSDYKKNNKFDTLIIHRTMLNKMFESKNDEEKIVILNFWSENFPNILVATGGGTLSYPASIMNRIKKVPFSPIKKLLLDGSIAKNYLTDII